MTRRRVPFTVRDDAHKKLTCNRCRRALRAGEDAVTIITAGQAVHRHAGRYGPPAPNYNDPSATRVIQGADRA